MCMELSMQGGAHVPRLDKREAAGRGADKGRGKGAASKSMMVGRAPN
jgi:hypothetical protein